MRWLVLLMSILFFLSNGKAQSSIYSFSFTTIEGETISFETFKGKKILIVNTASKSNFTCQYLELQQLKDSYNECVEIIAFPCDNFAKQELESNQEIENFCQKEYGVNFYLSEKVEVIGPNSLPLFRWLVKQKNESFTGKINWNFEKFLIDENGQLINRFRSDIKPDAVEIVRKL